MSPVATKTPSLNVLTPRVLIVDDEPTLFELISDTVGRQVKCRLVCARDLREARRILENDRIELMVADIHLPDGDGMSLLPLLRERQPEASAIVITGAPTIEGAISAIRAGALDFVPKPFDISHLIERVRKALQRQAHLARKEKRLDRLRDAVRRLNEARKVVSRKVDLLCNDLITAYGELSKQFDTVRTQEGFRRHLEKAGDLEQMLCHTMDWLLREMGYANIAIWLAADVSDFQLGAYMKYTIAGDRKLTDAMRQGIVPLTLRKGLVHFGAAEAEDMLTREELAMLEGQSILSANCTYMADSLAVITLFRDDDKPFTDQDADVLRSVSTVFGSLLATIVREHEEFQADVEQEYRDVDDPTSSHDRGADADWWKRGEPPPF